MVEMAPIPIMCDDQGTIKLIETGVIKQKTKNIAVKFRHFHDERNKGTIMFSYVHSAENPADLLTKALPLSKLLTSKILLGLEKTYGHVMSLNE
jgi:hypothetical protein